jgi:hypothetical protein
MSLCKRSYDQRVRKDVHPTGYKLTSNSIGEFGTVDGSFYTKAGLATLTRNSKQFEARCEERRLKEIYDKEHKREILAAKVEPRWASACNYGREL